MTVRGTILFGILVVLGVHSFRQQSLWNRRRLAWLRVRERRLARAVGALRQEQRDLRAEARALCTDHYYVERTLREELGWRPLPHRVPAGAPAGAPGMGVPGRELVLAVPRLAPAAPPATGPLPGAASRAPAAPGPAPARRQEDVDRALLAWLGYGSVSRFQRKMMRGRGAGEMDGATRRRARGMVAMLRRVGYESVRAFQARHGLVPDGIYGRLTERAVVQALRRTQGVVVEGGSRPGHRPGG